MNIEKFTGPGSTPARRQFWDSVSDAVELLRKAEGTNVSVAEHDGLGTVINFPDNLGQEQIGSCCIGVGFYYGSCFDGYTRSACEDDPDVQGVWHAEPCDDVDCIFACCHGGLCTDETEAHCADIGGIFQGLDVFCSDDPPPDCSTPAICPDTDTTIDASVSGMSDCPCHLDGGHTFYETYAIDLPDPITLTYDFGIGAWYALLTGVITQLQWDISNTDCSGDPLHTNSLDAAVRFFCTEDMSGTYAFFDIDVAGGSAATAFDSGTVTPRPPGPPLVLDNALVTCAIDGSEGAFETGGTVTLSWV